jgi:hypothetical protein
VKHWIRDEIRRLGVAVIRWSQPIPFSGSDDEGEFHVRRFYPPRFDAASVGAEGWTSELRARAVASNIAVATYEVSASPLPAGVRREYYRIKAAIRSYVRDRDRPRPQRPRTSGGPSARARRGDGTYVAT